MPQGILSATIFIWYPNNGRIGHSSLFIGNIARGMILNPLMDFNEASRNKNVLSMGCLRAKLPEDLNYVSWWPVKSDTESRLGLLLSKHSSRLHSDLDKDVEEEGLPHVIYSLSGLSVEAMKMKWLEIKNKYEYVFNQNTSYSALGKNCSTIIWRVLKAGGIKSLIPTRIDKYWKTHSRIWTPKKLSTVCDSIPQDYCEKTKQTLCPTKESLRFQCMLGLR